MKLRLLQLLIALTLLPFSASALEVTIGGITYEDVPGEGMAVKRTSLSIVNIPETITVKDSIYPVTSIAKNAFANTALYGDNSTASEVRLPASVHTIGAYAFSGSIIEKVIIPEGLKIIGNNAFSSCWLLTELELPSTLESMGFSCFSSSAVRKVVMKDDNMKVIPAKAFSNCSSLEEIILPEKLEEIEKEAFYNCERLPSIMMPDSLRKIGIKAFQNCKLLKEITLPPLIKTIEEETFDNCVNLKYVGLPSDLLTISQSAFRNCKKLQTIAIPNNTRRIYAQAFENCTELTEIYLPASLISIEYEDGYGPSAFNNCPNLTKVHNRSRIPVSFGGKLFIPYDKNEDVKYELYVPKDTKDLYKAIDTYKRFDIIEEEMISINLEAKRAMLAGTDTKLTPVIFPTVYPLGSLNWLSSSPSVASVDSYGNVTALKEGNTVISVSTKAEGETITARCTVEVAAKPTASFAIQPITLGVNSIAALPVEMVNENEIVAFQCDIYLPDGMEFAKDDEGEFDFTYAGREGRSHVLESRRQPDGSVRVVGYSPSNATFKNSHGALFYIPVSLPSALGDYTIRIANILVTEKSLREMPAYDVECSVYVGPSLVGDANTDGRITISDAAIVSAYILGETTEGFSFANADVVPDGQLTLADVSEIVNKVLGAPQAAMPRKVMRAHGVEFPTREGDRISLENIVINPGEEAAVTVSFENAEPFTSFFTEIILPEGLKFVEEDGEYFIDLASDRKTRSHTTACKVQDDGRMRAMAYSSTNALFKGNEGPLFTFYITADDDFDNTRPCRIRMENNYICNRNAEGQFTDYDVNNCEALVNLATGVQDVTSDGWSVRVADGMVEIMAPESADVKLYRIDGTYMTIHVEKGSNIIDNLKSGIYIIKGAKVVIR